MGAPRGVILDMDGTLVDSNDAHAHAWVDALQEAGYAVPFAQVRPLIGMGSDNLLPEVLGRSKETPEGERLSERWGEIFKERYLPRLRPFPGAKELVARLRADGLTVAVGSSSKDDLLAPLLDLVGIADLVDATTSSSDAERSKPDPDIIQAALQKGELAPAQVLLLGDTPYDIAAAGKAGVRTIALRCGGFGDRELAGAIAIYDDPADLLARYDESPLGAAAGARA